MVGPIRRYLKIAEGEVQFDQAGECKIRFEYKDGTHKLNLLGVQLTTDAGKVLSEDVHKAHVGSRMVNNEYTINVPEPGVYHLRYWVETKTETITSKGIITFSTPVSLPRKETSMGTPENLVRGSWIRKAPLDKNTKWEIASVIVFFAPEQQRRSLLAYIERERPVPYRSFIHHNDWYEIGITCNNAPDPSNRHSEAKSLGVIKTWENEMFRKRNVTIDAFVLNDGWDDFDRIGNMGDPRDRWITYRDRLVYEVFVQGSPLMPINFIIKPFEVIVMEGRNTENEAG